MLERQEASCAADARLHLIADQWRARVTAQPLHSPQIAIWGQVDALALYRLDDKRRHVAAFELSLQRVGVAERDGLAARQQRSEAIAKLVVAVERECPKCEPMESVLGEQHTPAASGRARDLDRALDRLSAAVSRHHRRNRAWGTRE